MAIKFVHLQLIYFVASVTSGVVSIAGDSYYVGVGRYDVTGPAVEVEMASSDTCYSKFCYRSGGPTHIHATLIPYTCRIYVIIIKFNFNFSSILTESLHILRALNYTDFT